MVFDLDGTLIESEQIWRDVRREFVVANGGHWKPDAAAAMIGISSGIGTPRLPRRSRAKMPRYVKLSTNS